MSEILNAIKCLQKEYYCDSGILPTKIWISPLLIAKLEKELSEQLMPFTSANWTSILGLEVQDFNMFGIELPNYFICVGK